MNKFESNNDVRVESGKWEQLRDVEFMPATEERNIENNTYDVDESLKKVEDVYANLEQRKNESLEIVNHGGGVVKSETFFSRLKSIFAKNGEAERKIKTYNLIKEAKLSGGHFLEHMKANRRSYEKWDNEEPKIPHEIGKMIESYIEDPDMIFCIHRSADIDATNLDQDETLKKILTEGLRNYGDKDSGGFHDRPEISKTTTICENMHTAVVTLKSGYKGSTGSIILALPSKYFNKNKIIKDEHFDDIYRRDEKGVAYIRPEFIKGFLTRIPEEKVSHYKTREELLESHE